jgi:hypothetical protein
MVYIHHIFFVHSLVVVHLGDFCGLAIVKRVEINMGGQVSLLYISLHTFGYIPKSGMAGS